MKMIRTHGTVPSVWEAHQIQGWAKIRSSEKLVFRYDGCGNVSNTVRLNFS